MLIDTHCHLDFKDFDPDRDDVLARASQAGVGRIIDVASSIDGSRRTVALANRYAMVYASVGVHPHEASSVTDGVIADLKGLAKDKKVVAIGEVGLDYYRNLAPRDEQIAAFRKFIRLASDLGLPLILHTRQADKDALDILRSERSRELKGVVHCFSGNADFLKECLDLGLYISFTCILTFKNAEALREVAKIVPPERLLLETDAPYLAPQAFRGTRNEPMHLQSLIEEWSRLLALSKEDIARITTHNANELFSLELAENAKIAYEIRDSLYLNITKGCTNACSFCIRNQTEFVKGHNLWLEKDPSVEELLRAIGDAGRYKEIVFCGYGEPTLRLDVIKVVAAEVKKKGKQVRVVTNGHGDLINGRSIARELVGLVDRVSVSLNAQDAELYQNICQSRFGLSSYKAILDFITACVACGIETEVTCLDLPGVDVQKCESMAREMGAGFRLRRFGVVG